MNKYKSYINADNKITQYLFFGLEYCTYMNLHMVNKYTPQMLLLINIIIRFEKIKTLPTLKYLY